MKEKKYVKVAITESELKEFKKFLAERKEAKKVLKEHGRGQDIELRDSNPDNGDILGKTNIYQREDMRIEKLFRKQLWNFKVSFEEFLDQFGVPYEYRSEFTPLDDIVALELRCKKIVPKLKKGEEDDTPFLAGRVIDGITRIVSRAGFRLYPNGPQSFDLDIRIPFTRQGVEEFTEKCNQAIATLKRYGEKNNKRV
jgi:hypothetical protein